ncbi:carboxypeptidase B-like [Chrysoperla carnea]|uniref:carboxypeptidase B-like n=1 Tax=Chrysoperla carnea TaxID=189513 RepID=UPI001D07F973|nr:carboxypeptidase B-like [Chrysoperla carnea]
MKSSNLTIRNLYLLFLVGFFIMVQSLKDYSGYKIYVFLPKDDIQDAIVRDIIDLPGVDAFKAYRRLFAPEYMIAPETQPLINDICVVTNLSYAIAVHDLGHVFRRVGTGSSSDYEVLLKESTLPRVKPGYISFQQYETYENVQAYLDRLALQYPQLMDMFSIGNTYEGRNITVARITNQKIRHRKPVILIDAGIHAREWIAPAFALYIIHKLVERSYEHSALLDNFEWFIIPLLNPDGYEYSRTNDRLWRKNRAPNFNTECIGTDLNRNWGYHWESNYHRECDSSYSGDEEFSEFESRALRDLGYALGDDVLVYLTLHAYGPLLLYPWGFKSEVPPDYADLDSLAKAMTDALSIPYVFGSSNNVLYAAPGGSDDWFKGVIGTKYSYTWELPPGGTTGFEIPEHNIMSTVVDSFNAIEALGAYFLNLCNQSQHPYHSQYKTQPKYHKRSSEMLKVRNDPLIHS